MLETDRRKIVELLYQQEMILGRLYQIFAARFAEYADFWTDLAGEEVRHAELIQKLYQAGKKDWVSFREGKIRAQSIRPSLSMSKALPYRRKTTKSISKVRLPIPWIWKNHYLKKTSFPVLKQWTFA